MRFTVELFASVLLSFVAPSIVFAGPSPLLWGPEGVAASKAPGAEVVLGPVPDGSGGSYLFGANLGVAAGDPNRGVFLQRVDARGSLPWGSGRSVKAIPTAPLVPAIGAAPDGEAGVIVFWAEPDAGEVYAQRIGPEGGELWQPGGVPLFETAVGPNGCPIARSGSEPARIVADGAGGAVVAMPVGAGSDCTGLELLGQHLDAHGIRSWGHGAALTTETAGGAQLVRLLPDAPGGALVVVRNLSGPPYAYGQKIDASGVRLWGAAGVTLAQTSSSGVDVDAVPDGAGGILIAWSGAFVTSDPQEGPGNRVFVQHVDRDGQRLWNGPQPVWADPSGVPVALHAGAQWVVSIARDLAGGALVSFASQVDGAWALRAQRIATDGSRSWTDQGRAVADLAFNPAATKIFSTADGQSIVLWDVYDPSRGGASTFAQALAADGTRRWTDDLVVQRYAGTSGPAPIGASFFSRPDGWGGVLLTWPASDLAAGSGIDVVAQRLSEATDPYPSLPVLNAAVTGAGTIEADDGSLSCTAPCSRGYPAGQALVLHATPQPGFQFAAWSGDCTGTADCSITMSADRHVTATFTPIPPKPDAIGMYRPSTGTWYVDRNGNGKWDGCIVDGCLAYGVAGDVPIAADWGGTHASWVAVYRASAGARWYLDGNGNGHWDGCATDPCLGPYGIPGDVPVAGDWTKLGVATIGVYRPSNGTWYLDRNGNGQWNGCAGDLCKGPFGIPGDVPVVGDWTGSGVTRIGVYRPSKAAWYLDKNGSGTWNGCTTDTCFGPYGVKGDVPVVGDWSGDGRKKIGVYRPSNAMWYLDANGNGAWDGCAVDRCAGPYGIKGDVPVVGQW